MYKVMEFSSLFMIFKSLTQSKASKTAHLLDSLYPKKKIACIADCFT